MAKTIKKLTTLKVKNLKQPGWYPDGMGLYLQVSKTCSKSWVYRYESNGKERRKGLGSNTYTTLENARQKAQECRLLRKEGVDPIDYKKQQDAEKVLEQAKAITFKECALAYIESQKSSWRNRKHESQWRNTLETYAYPVIGDLSVQDVDIGHVLKILEPIWYEKTETASRVRQRIENVLDWAKVRKYRDGENPALWRGHLDKVLPARSKVQKIKHFEAMPYIEVPEYFRHLKKDSLASKALAFTILTAARNGEARGTTWDEIDFNNNIWTVPESRMKANRTHRVPLSTEAVKVLKNVLSLKTDDRVFPGLRKDQPISEAALLKLLKQDHPKLTIHGFRSSFRDWCAEQTNFPRELAESALAHTLTDRTEAAYQRGDYLEKRRELMESWASYLSEPRGKVVSIRTKTG